MADIRIRQLPNGSGPVASDYLPIDNGTTRRATIQEVVEIGRPTASQAEAEAGTNPTKAMTPLTVKQSIASEVGVSIASAAQGALADTAVQPARTVNTGTGLTGGGNLSADRTIALDGASIASLALADGAAQKAQNLADLADKASGRFNLKVPVYAADRTALKALDTTKDILAYLKEDGREGIFEWTSGDFSTLITADTLEGVYIKADAIASTAGAWVRRYDGPLRVEWFGAVGDGATDDAPTINAAIRLSSALLGGVIRLSAKTYAVSDQNTGAVSTFDHWAIVFDQGHDNIELSGVPGSKIKLLNAANCTVIQIGRNTNTTPPSGVKVSGIEIDGNRANQDAPLASTKHWPGLMTFIFGGVCERVIFEDLYIHDCQYYGIGFEMEDAAGTEFRDCHVRNVVIEDTGADGFDAKDYQNGSYGNTVENITVRRWGLANAGGALLSGQAGIDIRSGWTVENAYLDEGNAASIPDQEGIRLQVGSLSASATPVQPSRVSKFTIRGSNGSGSRGLRVQSIYNTCKDGHIEGFVDGVSVSNQHCKLDAIVAKLNTNGARFWATGGTTAALSSAENCNFRDNTGTGVIVTGVDSVSLINTHVRTNLVGINIDASSPNFVFIGGSLSGNTTQATITTVVPYIRNVVGYRTKRTYTTTGAIDSTGSKDITFAHGMPFTPRIQDCQASFRQSTAVTDWSAAFIEIQSTDATNVVVRYRVDVASATGSALVGINLVVDAFNGV